MRQIKIQSLSILFLCMSFLMFSSFFSGQELENFDQENIEKFLKTAKDVSVERGRGRRTDSWVVELDDGITQRRGFFKLTDRDWSSASGGDSYKFVIAGYEMDKLLDLNMVPPTVERKFERKKGSLMLYLEPPLISEEDRRQKELLPPNEDDFKKTMCDLVVFEHLIYFPSTCNQRDLGNILIQTGLDWKVWLVDLSTAFAPAERLIPGCEITDCSEGLINKLENLDRNEVKAKLGAYLNDTEISALLVRKDLILEKVKGHKSENN